MRAEVSEVSDELTLRRSFGRTDPIGLDELEGRRREEERVHAKDEA